MQLLRALGVWTLRFCINFISVKQRLLGYFGSVKMISFYVTLIIHIIIVTQIPSFDYELLVIGAGIIGGYIIRRANNADAEKQLGWGIMAGSIADVLSGVLLFIVVMIFIGGGRWGC